MVSLLRHCIRVSTACVLITVFGVPPSLMAQAHLVSPGELQKATVAATQARQRNIETVRNFLSSAVAERPYALRTCNPNKCSKAFRI